MMEDFTALVRDLTGYGCPYNVDFVTKLASDLWG